ncbi:hypothetical protein H1W37_08325 [Stappia taiwanensis]|uniref:Uncharacterized protein n=1 Tax=Stappia taiwanensis TaxID=992267 RepID=A0A838XXN4_9HYPH|nr:hypothetical protein [Stappia taiwanensis]MBA4611653.1 hypothetical protein [Stappia taiwanensis]
MSAPGEQCPEAGATYNTIVIVPPPEQEEQQSGDTGRSVAQSLTDVALVVAPLALGYFAGIAYLDAFLTAFSISIHEVDAPLATIVAHSYNVFTHAAFIWKLLGIGAVIAVLAWIFAQLRQSDAALKTMRWRYFFLISLPIAAFLTFMSIKASADETARIAAHRIWNEANAIVIPRTTLSVFENRLGVAQRLRFSKCLAGAEIKHLISTPQRSYSLCVINSEGFLVIHLSASDRYLPVRRLQPCVAREWRKLPFCTKPER